MQLSINGAICHLGNFVSQIVLISDCQEHLRLVAVIYTLAGLATFIQSEIGLLLGTVNYGDFCQSIYFMREHDETREIMLCYTDFILQQSYEVKMVSFVKGASVKRWEINLIKILTLFGKRLIY